RVFFEDDEVFERLLAVEADLTDAYVRGEMAAADREEFERRALSSPRRRRGAGVAGGLAAFTGEGWVRGAPPSSMPEAAGRKGSFIFSLAAAAALLIAIGGPAFRAAQVRADRARLEEQLSALKLRVADLEQRNQRLEPQIRQPSPLPGLGGSEGRSPDRMETGIHA